MNAPAHVPVDPQFARRVRESFGQRSGGNWFAASIAAARGAISFAAKSCTDWRNIATVSPWSNCR